MYKRQILPNPHWEDELRSFTGKDEPVRKWLEKDDAVKRMISDVLGFLKTWLPAFQNSQRSYVTVGIGCTGGQHRSVYLVERLASELSEQFSDILVHHREMTP